LDKRLSLLKQWLDSQLNFKLTDLKPASEDASFRRYFRLFTASNTYIVMDAPPDREKIDSFLSVAKALTKQHIHAPAIHHHSEKHGFIVMEDLGNRTYLNDLIQNSEPLYSAAIDTLILLQRGHLDQPSFALPSYTENLLNNEMELFNKYFLNKHLKSKLNINSKKVWADTKEFLCRECLAQPQVWVHRDYHSRNLMITAKHSPGVIDFQDMVLGPIAYDLASIFKDCYIEWPRQKQHEWLAEYHQKLLSQSPEHSFSLDTLIRWVDLTGLQRHLKVLGIFCRLNYRDGKEQYMGDLPLVAKYVLEVIKLYPELDSFKEHFSDSIEKVL